MRVGVLAGGREGVRVVVGYSTLGTWRRMLPGGPVREGEAIKEAAWRHVEQSLGLERVETRGSTGGMVEGRTREFQVGRGRMVEETILWVEYCRHLVGMVVDDRERIRYFRYPHWEKVEGRDNEATVREGERTVWAVEETRKAWHVRGMGVEEQVRGWS